MSTANNQAEAKQGHELRSTLLATWSIGCLLNTLSFHLRQAQLFAGRTAQRHWKKCEMLFDDLQLAVQESVDAVEIAEELRDRVREARDEWNDLRELRLYFLSTVSLWEDLEAQAEYEFRAGESVMELQLRRLREFLQYTDHRQKTLQHQIEQFLDQIHRRSLRLGKLIDEAIRPPDALAEMMEQRTGLPEGDEEHNEAEPAEECEIPVESPAKNIAPERHLLPMRSFGASSRPVRKNWYREVRQRWAQLGLPISSLPENPADGAAAKQDFSEQAYVAAEHEWGPYVVDAHATARARRQRHAEVELARPRGDAGRLRRRSRAVHAVRDGGQGSADLVVRRQRGV